MKTILEGSQAVAMGVSLCRPNVVCAYPITPQTHIVEALASEVANGKLDDNTCSEAGGQLRPLPGL